jgi:uncharacterized protein (DUF488 family)
LAIRITRRSTSSSWFEANRSTSLVDVRSYPYSRFAPHLDREAVERSVRGAGIGYIFLGEDLGGRPSDESHFDKEGHALYGEMAATAAFRAAIARLLAGAGQGRLAIMCSCGKPDECHRRLLVGKILTDRGAELVHILPSGQVRSERSVPIGAQDRLLVQAESARRSTQSVSHRRRLNTSSAA